MTFQECPGIAQVVIEQSLRGELMQNIVHYENSVTAWDPANLLTLANLVKTNWLTSTSGLKACQSIEAKIQRVTARDLTTEAGAEVISSVADGQGQNTDAAIENSLAAVVTLSTGVAGRSYRGRLYVGGLGATSSSYTDANHMTSGFAASIAAEAAYTFTNGLSADWQHVVLSRQHDKLIRPEGIGTEIFGYTCNVRLDNQRRRMPRL